MLSFPIHALNIDDINLKSIVGRKRRRRTCKGHTMACSDIPDDFWWYNSDKYVQLIHIMCVNFLKIYEFGLKKSEKNTMMMNETICCCCCCWYCFLSRAFISPNLFTYFILFFKGICFGNFIRKGKIWIIIYWIKLNWIHLLDDFIETETAPGKIIQ